MLNEKKQAFCELYANKEDLKLTHEGIALELGISTKTIQRWLKEPEVIQEINKVCASRLDRLVPVLASNTEKLLNSKSANDKVKGMDTYWKLQDKLDRASQGNQISREKELIQEAGKTWIDIMGKDCQPDLLINLFMESVKWVFDEKYKSNISEQEIEKFLMEHGIE